MVTKEPSVREIRRTLTTVRINGEDYKAIRFLLSVHYTESVPTTVSLLDCPGSFFTRHVDEFKQVSLEHFVIVDPRYWERYNPHTDSRCYNKDGWDRNEQSA